MAVIGAGIVAGALLLGGGEEPAVTTPSPTVPAEPRLLSISIRSLPQPLVAVVGISAAGETSAIVMPPSLLVTIPGGGDATLSETALRSGGTLAATISNVLGTWIGNHATTDMVGLTDIIDRAGGLTLPGSTQPSTGDEVRTYLGEETGSERARRFTEVLSALLARPVELAASDVREPGELQMAQPILSQVSAPTVNDLPTRPAQSHFVVADESGISNLLSSSFGVDAMPEARVAVLNGSGEPGVGESVAGILIPADFRIVSSQNAQTFGQKTTKIVAQGEPAAPLAERVHTLLGVGRVIVVQQRSGFADVTLLVGEDFKGNATG